MVAVGEGLGGLGVAVGEGVAVAADAIAVTVGTTAVADADGVPEAAEATYGSVGVGEPITQTFRVAVTLGSTSTSPPVDT